MRVVVRVFIPAPVLFCVSVSVSMSFVRGRQAYSLPLLGCSVDVLVSPPQVGNWIQGDGRLLFSGVDGPLSSIRLDNLRDGVEDFELLTMCAAHAGEKAVLTILEELSHGITSPVRNLSRLISVRHELASTIINSV